MNTKRWWFHKMFRCFFIIGITLFLSSCSFLLSEVRGENSDNAVYVVYIGNENDIVRVYLRCEDDSPVRKVKRLPIEPIKCSRYGEDPISKAADGRECFHIQSGIDGWVKGTRNGEADSTTQFDRYVPDQPEISPTKPLESKIKPLGRCEDFGNNKRTNIFDLPGSSPYWGFDKNVTPYMLVNLSDGLSFFSCPEAKDEKDSGWPLVKKDEIVNMNSNKNALFVKAKFDITTKKSLPFDVYQYPEFLVPVLVGKKILTLKDRSSIEYDSVLSDGIPLAVNKVSGGLLEVELPSIIKAVPVGEEPSSRKLFPVRIILIGSEHDLSLAHLEQWDGDWGLNPMDKWLKREIYWIKIDKNATFFPFQMEFSLFQKYRAYAKRDPSIVSSLDGSKFFKLFADFLPQFLAEKNLRTVDYIVMLKDSWDIGKPDGIEDLVTQLKKLDAQVDILSTKSRSDTKVWFEALANGVNGRYYESNSSENLDEIKEINSMADRINGKIRAAYLPMLQEKGVSSTDAELPDNALFIKEDDANFTIINLTTFNFAQTMLDVIRMLKCLAQDNPIDKEGSLEHYLVALNLKCERPEFATMPLSQLFERWFLGFKLPSSSPIAKKSLLDIVMTAQEDNNLLKILNQVEDDLDKIIKQAEKSLTEKERRAGCQIYEIPLKIFILR